LARRHLQRCFDRLRFRRVPPWAPHPPLGPT
jgi:hypothetical protein